MKYTMTVLFLALVLCVVNAFANDSDPIDFTQVPHMQERGLLARHIANQIGDDIDQGNLLAVAQKADEGLHNAIYLAVKEMQIKGHQAEADQILFEYGDKFDGFLTRMVMMRNIGSHAAFSAWLETAYDKIEAALGVTICQLLKLDTIKIINCGIPVVFHPCTFPMDSVPGSRMVEYRRHFSGKTDGEIYDGFVPCISYWVAWGACEAATFGGGWFVICSPLGTLVEIAEERWITPGLSDKIYTRACGTTLK